MKLEERDTNTKNGRKKHQKAEKKLDDNERNRKKQEETE